MKKQTFLKGPKLFALARVKARDLGIETGGLTLVELIHQVQVKEGHSACFREVRLCPELKCCWQASCGAEMTRG